MIRWDFGLVMLPDIESTLGRAPFRRRRPVNPRDPEGSRRERADMLVLDVDDPIRLEAVRQSDLYGHLGDADLDAIVSTLAIACDVPVAVVNIVTHNRQTYAAEIGVNAPFTTVEDHLSFCAEVVETGRELVISDASSHRVYAENPLVCSGAVRAYAGEPLVHDGFVIGSVAVFDSRPRTFAPHELEVLRHQARLVEVVLRLRQAARGDMLTGLPNRAVLLDRLAQGLAQQRRRPGKLAVLFLDVDGFKGVNDELGHLVGDRVLVEAARRLRTVLRPGDTLARIGGDEFVALCADLPAAEDAAVIAERFISSIRPCFHVDGVPITLGVSVGIAVADAGDGDDRNLLDAADKAMYLAKQKGGSMWAFAPAHQPAGSCSYES